MEIISIHRVAFTELHSQSHIHRVTFTELHSQSHIHSYIHRVIFRVDFSSSPTHYSHRVVAASHLQPTDAREVFPCFDEPVQKAVFHVTILHDHGTVALSNSMETGQWVSQTHNITGQSHGISCLCKCLLFVHTCSSHRWEKEAFCQNREQHETSIRRFLIFLIRYPFLSNSVNCSSWSSSRLLSVSAHPWCLYPALALYMGNRCSGSDRAIINSSQSRCCFRNTEGDGCNLIGC